VISSQQSAHSGTSPVKGRPTDTEVRMYEAHPQRRDVRHFSTEGESIDERSPAPVRMHIQRFAWLKSSNSFTPPAASRTRNLETHQSSSDPFLLPSTMTNAIEYQAGTIYYRRFVFAPVQSINRQL
jgi:hypothetical protein